MQQLEIPFVQFAYELDEALDAAVENGTTVHGVPFSRENTKHHIDACDVTKTFTVKLQYDGVVPIKMQTPQIRMLPAHLVPSAAASACHSLLWSCAQEVRRELESAYVKSVIEAQDLRCIGAAVQSTASHTHAADVLHAGSFVVNCPKAWGGRGYGMLNYRIYACPKGDELQYGIYGEVIDCNSDGTFGLPVQLPFIGATPAQLADFARATHEWAKLLKGDA